MIDATVNEAAGVEIKSAQPRRAPSDGSASFAVGDRVKVFDPRLFVNDIKTPKSLTMQPATVLRLYRTNDGWRDLVMDVRFDRDGYESKCHFAWGVEHLTPNSEIRRGDLSAPNNPQSESPSPASNG